MSTFAPEEFLSSEIDRVRSKLLGTSCLGVETREDEKASPDLTERVRNCHSPCQQTNDMIDGTALVSLEAKEQIAKLPDIDPYVTVRQERPDNSDFETALRNKIIVGACPAKHEPEVSQFSPGCGNNDHAVSSSAISSAFLSDKSAQEILRNGNKFTKRSDTEYPLTAVEVSVSCHQQGGPFNSGQAKGTKAMTEIAKKAQQGSNFGQVKQFRRNYCFSSRPAQNLGKAPISVITLKTANNGLCTCGELLTNKALDLCEERLNTPYSKPEAKDVHASTDLRVKAMSNADLQTRSEAETVSSEVSQRYNGSEASTVERKRPAVRRRLSETIQNLQEKIQKELANNESMSRKENDIRAKTAEPQRMSSKLRSRFVRERSRKRSKSRVGYKVSQSARKYPQSNTKERPYRQWMGVGSCVAYDRRYIVSSNSSQDTKCLAKRELSKRKGKGEGPDCLSDRKEENGQKEEEPNGSGKDSDKNTATSPQLPKDSVDVLKGLLSESRTASRCANKEGLEAKLLTKPNKTEKHDLNAVPRAWLTSTNPYTSETKSIEETCYTSPLKSSSVVREGSRSFRRVSSYTERRVRSPTPHSYLSCGNEKTERSLFHESKASIQRSVRETLSDKKQALSVSRKEQTSHGLEQHLSRLFGERSPSKSELDGIMRTSKGFTAAPRQQRKHNRTARYHKENGDALLRCPIGKSITSSTQNLSYGGDSATSEDTAHHHGSMDTLWSNVSSTTWESSTRTESSSSWYSKDIKHDKASPENWQSQSSPDLQLTGTGSEVASKSVLDGREKNTAVHTRKYVDVQAVIDFKGTLPGQLSFRKGQIIRQMVSSSECSNVDMSYGYYRTGALKRKKKGLFPSACVARLSQ
ncbi:hypothetical protein ElyMa_002843800 [Elysia marginata]|uniref:SH3 domain-containing protein n=1 Tax=Elysia marginata TaxID=1093978 RepID=A0AAV4HWA5_9GAST|nr:hypothetical protein ElyMa_002843800 [Elysia marginata]